MQPDRHLSVHVLACHLTIKYQVTVVDSVEKSPGYLQLLLLLLLLVLLFISSLSLLLLLLLLLSLLLLSLLLLLYHRFCFACTSLSI